MRAALIEEFGKSPRVSDVPDPKCPPDGVLVEIKACGVCRSDHHAWSGVDPRISLPHVGGHEFAGIIVETGANVSRFSVGDRVTAPFILGCGVCPDCLSGEATICDHQQVIGFTQWGAFADHIAIDRADFNLVHLPDGLQFEHAAAMGCRLTTAWRALTTRANLQAGEWVAIHGTGGIGLSAILVAQALGARVIATDIDDEKLSLARDLGAELVVNARTTGEVADTVREMTGGGAHVSVDALGITETFDNSIRSLRKLGRHVQIGMPVGQHKTVALPLLELVYLRQISILGTRGMSAGQFSPLLKLVENGTIDPTQLVSRTVGLEDLGTELENLTNFSGVGIAVINRF